MVKNPSRAQPPAPPSAKAGVPFGPIIGLALIAGVVGGAIAWGVASRLTPGRIGTDDAQIAVLDQRIAQQSDVIRELRAEIDQLRQTVLRPGTARSPGPGGPSIGQPDGAVPPLLEDRDNRFGGYADLMLLSARRRTNDALRTIPQSRLIEVFGAPAEGLGQDCVAPTSPRLVSALTLRDVGPFRARLVKPAVDSLERIFARLKAEEPALYANLRSYGGLCARLIRGSSERISRHAFGVAIDVSVGGTIDAMGDGKTQFGLILLADYFQDEGWLWGAAFRREDSMHFEVSASLFERWLAEGLI